MDDETRDRAQGLFEEGRSINDVLNLLLTEEKRDVSYRDLRLLEAELGSDEAG